MIPVSAHGGLRIAAPARAKVLRTARPPRRSKDDGVARPSGRGAGRGRSQPEIKAASGTPRPSVRMCLFTPALGSKSVEVRAGGASALGCLHRAVEGRPSPLDSTFTVVEFQKG